MWSLSPCRRPWGASTPPCRTPSRHILAGFQVGHQTKKVVCSNLLRVCSNLTDSLGQMTSRYPPPRWRRITTAAWTSALMARSWTLTRPSASTTASNPTPVLRCLPRRASPISCKQLWSDPPLTTNNAGMFQDGKHGRRERVDRGSWL